MNSQNKLRAESIAKDETTRAEITLESLETGKAAYQSTSRTFSCCNYSILKTMVSCLTFASIVQMQMRVRKLKVTVDTDDFFKSKGSEPF